MEPRLSKISISGFKSIRELTNFPLRNINVLIGANGSGKSNFIDFFKLLRAATGREVPGAGKTLNSFLKLGGGIEDFLFRDKKKVQAIQASLTVANHEVTFCLNRSVKEEVVAHDKSGEVLSSALLGALIGGFLGGTRGAFIGAGASTLLLGSNSNSQTAIDSSEFVQSGTLEKWSKNKEEYADIAPYHFHDTSPSSPMRSDGIIHDNNYLRLDAANIAPFLLRLKRENPHSYEDTIEAIQTVAPFFEGFTLRVRKKGEKETVNLEWNQKDSDYPMQPYQLSDGTLRFICLATALLQPDLPEIIIIDEPELGLHPFALSILSELIHSAAMDSQIIIATQSAVLVDQFQPEDIIVVNRVEGASVFERLDSDKLSLWLEEYSLGQLWQKNVVAGGPDYA